MEVSANVAQVEPIAPPVVAVSRFENLGEERHGYLVNGLGEELTAELSRCSGLRVVAFCSMARLAESPRDIQEIASAVAANFMLTGTLRKSGNRVRINTQLLDVGTGEQLWGQRFDEDFLPDRMFDLEDRIVRQVLVQVADTYGVIPRMMSLRAEGRRVSEPSAYEAILRCLHYQLTMTPEAFRESLRALEHASQIEPNSAIVWAMLSQSYLDAEVFGYGDIPGTLKDGIRFAGRAVSLDPGCQFAQHAKAYASLVNRDRTAMIVAAERMVAINPNAAFMTGCAGFWLCLAGEYERGMKLFRTSIELNPLFPMWLHAGPYFYHLDKGDYEQALHHANEFGLPDFFWGPLIRAAVLGLLGRTNDARTAYVSLLALKPDFAANAADYVRFFLLDDRLAEKMLIGLKKAGLVDRTPD